MSAGTGPAISGTFVHADGTMHHFRVTAEGYQQWGADPEHHGRTVETLGRLRVAAGDEGFWEGVTAPD